VLARNLQSNALRFVRRAPAVLRGGKQFDFSALGYGRYGRRHKAARRRRRTRNHTTLIGAPGNIGSLTGSDGVYFFGYTGSPGFGVNLWRTDGTDTGTVQYATLPVYCRRQRHGSIPRKNIPRCGSLQRRER